MLNIAFVDFRPEILEGDWFSRVLFEFQKNIVDIKEEFEPKRVFTPLFNSLAYDLRKKGTLRGRLSPRAIVYSELKYNRPNFYDESIDLPVGVTRQEYLPIYIETNH